MAVYRIVPSQGKVFSWIREHSADILTYGGLGLMTGSTIAACVGTKRMMENKEEIEKEPSPVKRCVKRGKHYILATAMYGSGVYMIHKGHQTLVKKNAELTSTIIGMTAATAAYRERWQNKVGEEEEEKIFLDEKTEEIEGKNGKKTKVKTSSIPQELTTDRFFDRFCSWMADETGDIDYDERVVRGVCAQLNQRLRGSPERMLVVNNAYDMLGLFRTNKHGQRVDDRSVAGQVAGWIYDKEHPTGDNTIVITIMRTHRRLEDGTVIPTLRLHFNHDGNIMKQAQERGLLQ